MVGPEKSLSLGVVDRFQENGLKIFGPTLKAARVETSKWFAKQLMLEHGMPTGKAEYIKGELGLTGFDKGVKILKNMSPPYVVKADGLYAGKGVIVTSDIEEAKETLHQFLEEKNGCNY